MTKSANGRLRVQPSDDELIQRAVARIADGGSLSEFRTLYRRGVSFNSEVAALFFELLPHITYKPPRKRGRRKKLDKEKIASAHRLADALAEAVRIERETRCDREQACRAASILHPEFQSWTIKNAGEGDGDGHFRKVLKSRQATDGKNKFRFESVREKASTRLG